jgi:hypothetical protein
MTGNTFSSSDSERAPAGWPAFAVKVALALLWIAAVFAGGTLLKQDDLLPRALGGLLVAGPALLWMLSIQRRARVDELEARLALSTLAQGGWWAVSFGAMMYGLQAAMGDPPGAFLLALLPWGAFAFGETMTQVARVQMARKVPGR